MGKHDPKALLDALQHAALPDIELTSRPMFGGILAYAAGKPAASLSDVGLALKLGGAARDELLAAGGVPLRYEPDAPPSKSYTVVPDAWIDDRDALRPWLERCIAFVAAGPAKRR